MLLLAAVASAYVVLSAVLVPLDLWPNWDEIVYISQLGIHEVPMVWGGHRAWGSVVLMAPVAVFTKSVVVMRIYLLILAGLAMFAAFRPWIGVFGRGRLMRLVPALAAAVFGLQWLTLYYASEGFPNLWLAFAFIGGLGCYLRARQRPSRRTTAGIVVAFGAAALLRPTDAIVAALPLLATVLVLLPPLRRRWPDQPRRPAIAVAAGLAIGTLPWIVEAYARFGGPIERLRGSSANAGAGLRWRLSDQLAAVDGPYTLCSNDLCDGVAAPTAVWWFLLPILAVAAVWFARRHEAGRPLLATFACAVCFTLPYFTVVGDSHPRFLMTAYGLLSIGVAWLLLAGLGALRGAARPVGAMALAVLLAAQAVVHVTALRPVLDIQIRISDETAIRSHALVAAGVRAPCVLYGQYVVGLAYEPGCDRRLTSAPPCPPDRALQQSIMDGVQVVLVFRRDPVCEPFRHWRRVHLRNDVDAYLSR